MAVEIPDFTLTRGGYAFVDVHRFTKWVEERLKVTDTLPEEAVREAKFSIGRGRGYDVAEVDAWIDTLPVSPADPELEQTLDDELRRPADMRISADSDAQHGRQRLIIPVLLFALLLVFVLLQLINVF
ncbi:DivIVA domain-containing protein [Propionibacteriaceae bacterium Y1700]|uniref:DivIVA domain-containing protein n=1 Tax=Microlunatus sp. Y1700 TaxID=3418487 RepID=UPI003DA75FCF